MWLKKQLHKLNLYPIQCLNFTKKMTILKYKKLKN